MDVTCVHANIVKKKKRREQRRLNSPTYVRNLKREHKLNLIRQAETYKYLGKRKEKTSSKTNYNIRGPHYC